jgi:hypothetical protein
MRLARAADPAGSLQMPKVAAHALDDGLANPFVDPLNLHDVVSDGGGAKRLAFGPTAFAP